MSYEQPRQDISERDGGAGARPPDQAAEIKRLEARRRFLRGGGAAFSALVTMSPGRLGAVTVSDCAKAFPQFSVFIVNFNRDRGRGGSDQAFLNCLGLLDRAGE
jgi:hypothetical protein